MAGEKNRFTTTEKLWKLNDDTLSTPEHDEMVLWLLNHNNLGRIFSYLNEKELFRINPKKDHPNSKILSDMVSTLNMGNIFNIRSEVPISANNGFLVGYSDVVISIKQIFSNEFWKSQYPHRAKDMYEMYLSCIEVRGDLVGNDYLWWDFSIQHITKPKYIEVKPKIRSFGETLRQLRTYKFYLRTDDMYLFTKDMRFSDAFESQGIKIINANDFMTNI